MSEIATIDSSSLGILKINWETTGHEQRGTRRVSVTKSEDVLGDTDLLAKEEAVMASSSKVEALIMTLEMRHGFVLGKELIEATEDVLKEFSKEWIARAKQQSSGISRKTLRKALVGKGEAEAINFAREWRLLMKQVSKPEYRIEMDAWSFTLCVEKAERTFRFPYCSTAMSACNKIIQHYNRE